MNINNEKKTISLTRGIALHETPRVFTIVFTCSSKKLIQNERNNNVDAIPLSSDHLRPKKIVHGKYKTKCIMHQSPASMASMDIPCLATFEAAALLVEYAENFFVTIPGRFRYDLIQRPMVFVRVCY